MKKTTTAWMRITKDGVRRRVLIVASEVFAEYVSYNRAGWLVEGCEAR